MVLKPLARFAYRIFGRFVYKHKDLFLPLQEDLKKARLPYSLDEYVSLIILVALLSFLIFLLIGWILFHPLPFPMNIITALFGAIGTSAILSIILYNHPKMAAISRASEIDAVLPFAVMHMSTLAGSGIPPHHLFRIMGLIEKYGEVARECNIIYRDVSILGKDIFTALSDAAKESPSRLWAELLWGITSTLRSGGSLREYLFMRAKDLRTMIERKERELMETMNLLTEIYLIIFVMGPILVAIVLALLSMMGGTFNIGIDPVQGFALLTYLILPVTGVIFLLIAEMMKPREVV